MNEILSAAVLMRSLQVIKLVVKSLPVTTLQCETETKAKAH